MKKPTQAERILKLLREKGTVTNIQLNQIAFRYSARIDDLRKQGHNIQAKRLKQGVWEFKLVMPPKQMVLL